MIKGSKLPHYQVAHSPDADDIFMYAAINMGWVDTKDISLQNRADDIETLNQAALVGTYDATAISFGLYPHIYKDQALIKTATSFGEGYGPKVVRRKDKPLKRNFKVALSGKYTTNALLFRIFYPDAKPVYMNFLEIEEAVIRGVVDAGVLIHESILDFSDELVVEKELWDIWLELAGRELPLPLGGMVIRRSLPLNRAIELEKILQDAVKIAVNHKKLLGKMLIDRDMVRVDEASLDKYLSLYANDDSITLSEVQIEAIDKLFEIGFKHGFYSELIHTKDMMIPDEYMEKRMS